MEIIKNEIDLISNKNCSEDENNFVTISITGNGFIKDSIYSVIKNRIWNFKGKYIIIVDGKELSSGENI